MYVYIRSEPGLYTVGFYRPNGDWEPESDHESTYAAAERAAWLNGSRQTIKILRDPEEIKGVINVLIDTVEKNCNAQYNVDVYNEGLDEARELLKKLD